MITLFCIRPKGFNVGNDAIHLALQRYIHDAFGQVVNIINLPATARYESQAQAGLTAQTVYEINHYGDGVIIGGGNLYENGELTVDPNALEALEVPLMLFSLSHGRVYNRAHVLVDRTNAMPRTTVEALHRHALLSLARDEHTGEYLASLGIAGSRVCGCPTIFLDRVSGRLPDLHEFDRASVLISVRNPALMSIPLRRQAQVHGQICAIINLLREAGHEDVRLLCHDRRDIPFAASFPEVDFVYVDDIYTYLSLLRSCSLNITYRVHSALPCLSFGNPVIPISYDERAISLLQTVGFGDWNIDMIAGEDPVAAVADRYRRLDELPALRAAARPLWERLDEVMIGAFDEFASSVRKYHDRNGR